MAEDDDGFDPARITRLLGQKVGTEGRTVRDEASPELVEQAKRKRERRQEALKKAKKEERRQEEQRREVEARTTTAAEAEAQAQAEMNGVAEAAEAEAGAKAAEGEEGGESSSASRSFGWTRGALRSAAMWGGLQGADTALAEERIAQHMQRKSRAPAAPAMKALAEEDEEGEEEEGAEVPTMTMTAEGEEEVMTWWQKDALWQSLGCDSAVIPNPHPNPNRSPEPEPKSNPNPNANPNPRPQPQPQPQPQPHPQPQAEACTLLRCELPRDLPEVPGKSAFLAHHVLIVDNSGSMRTADVRSAAAGGGAAGGGAAGGGASGATRMLTRSEAVQGVLLHQFLLTQLASGVTTNERISLIKLEGGDAQAREEGGIRKEWD